LVDAGGCEAAEHHVPHGLRPHTSAGLDDPNAALARLAVPPDLVPIRHHAAPGDRRVDRHPSPRACNGLGHGAERPLGHDHPAITGARGEECVEPLKAGPARAVVELARTEEGRERGVENVGHSKAILDGGSGHGERENEEHAGSGQQPTTGRGHRTSWIRDALRCPKYAIRRPAPPTESGYELTCRGPRAWPVRATPRRPTACAGGIVSDR